MTYGDVDLRRDARQREEIEYAETKRDGNETQNPTKLYNNHFQTWNTSRKLAYGPTDYWRKWRLYNILSSISTMKKVRPRDRPHPRIGCRDVSDFRILRGHAIAPSSLGISRRIGVLIGWFFGGRGALLRVYRDSAVRRAPRETWLLAALFGKFWSFPPGFFPSFPGRPIIIAVNNIRRERAVSKGRMRKQ